jgi:hypothetical protein
MVAMLVMAMLVMTMLVMDAGDGHASPSMHVEDRNLSWKYVAQIAGNGVSGLQIFTGEHAPRPPS